ncbi:hypothetical protein FisN_5Lu172 [Fistulifera solaris]|uniref:Uncharacterized protein n=1 Tax=Fistulifera solaris TaxID=1519565 RepID=A0A1Z5JJI0_FISSO|nr:hypothetical protein FisN_5Lu172 [Fistulifera solaris]|eukprot:GAX13931.1 hypothetical protein FisN_5Lu172 [Fistulifera solaris]
MEILNEHWSYLLAPDDLIRVCSREVIVSGVFRPIADQGDILGRTEISHIVLQELDRIAMMSNQTKNTSPEENVLLDQMNTSMFMSNGDVFEIPEEGSN